MQQIYTMKKVYCNLHPHLKKKKDLKQLIYTLSRQKKKNKLRSKLAEEKNEFDFDRITYMPLVMPKTIRDIELDVKLLVKQFVFIFPSTFHYP